MMIGYNITQPNDALQKITLQQLIQLISHPPNEILDKITILRNLKITDLNAYKHQKKLLPYFTTSIFHPPYRKSENFAATYYCIFDIDNLSSIQKTPDEIKEQISKLECTRLAFTSPGMDGVKLLIELHTPCKEPSQFKSFYSAFIRYLISNFSHLSAVIDRKTNDITRATFLSYDPHLFHNPSSVKINIQQIIDAYSDAPPISISDNTNSNETSSTSDASIASNNPSNNPDEETLQKIKNILGSKTLSKTNPKNVIPSQKVNDTIPLLKEK
ncbi:MAG: CRISPR-associated primase-polymerase type B, partial [Thermoplasmata archaeon]